MRAEITPTCLIGAHTKRMNLVKKFYSRTGPLISSSVTVKLTNSF